MQHRIKKQVIEITIGKTARHFRVQQTMSDYYREEIVPMLEKAFDTISTEDVVMEIDRFVINLGTVSEKRLGSKAWTEEVYKQIHAQVDTLTGPGPAGFAVTLKTKRDSSFSQWMYYMEHGYLSWNSPLPDDEWRQQVLEAIAVDDNHHRRLQTVIARNSATLQRIVREHADGFLQQLAGILSTVKQEHLSAAIRQTLAPHLRDQEKVFSVGSTGNTQRNELWSLSLQWSTEKNTAGLPLADRLTSYLSNPVAQHQMEITPLQTNGRPVPIDEEGIFIVNAGIVLLHPFFKSLFARLNWLDEKSFRNDECRARAIYLLHYLASGKTDAMEFELLLPRLLCAQSLDLPVVLQATLTTFELSEADAMLDAAIAQWEKLKNSSPAALREGFLQRPGKIQTRNGNYYLQVEKRSIDILLDHLPWGLSMIRLPWMDEILKVEWR